jgi:hypothetical protein
VTPEDKDKITDDILEAFDTMAVEGAAEGEIEPEIQTEQPSDEPGDDEREGEPETEPDHEQPEEGEQVEEIEVLAEGDPGDEQPEDPGDDEKEAGEPEPVDEPEYAPDVQAFIDRHDGDLGKALLTAAEQYRVIGERNRLHGEMTRRVMEMEAELAQARAFQAGQIGLTPEQAEWVEAAIESEQPTAYIQSAVASGEFDLARAVCDAWGENGDAYAALRTRQMVDQAEGAAQYAQQAAEPPPTIPQEELFGMISEQVPDFSNYWAEMTEVVTQLGRGHPMVIAANSADPNEAATGLIDLYKVARTRATRVSEARKTVEEQQRERGVAKRKQARVSSSSSRTSHEEPPPTTKIGPGLTLEDLDAAFAAE